MDPNRPTATHVAVMGDRILAVGGADCADQWEDITYDESLSNFILTPGFVEGHAAYTKWFAEADVEFNRNTLIYALQDRPKGVFRMKGFVRAETRMLSVHVVGAHIDVTTFPNDVETGLVAIGLASEMNAQDLDAWWAKAKENARTPYSML